MRKIRSGVWETNSSSTHSITIAHGGDDALLTSLHVDNEGIVNLTPGKFGWQVAQHSDMICIIRMGISIAFFSEETLRQFIFNPRSILYLGNDNEG